MVFASLTFLLFFLPIVIGSYYLVSPRWRNHLLLVFCLVFYVWGGGLRDLVILLVVATTDFFVARKISTSRTPQRWLLGGLIWNLGILCFFKYAGFWLSIIQGISPGPIVDGLVQQVSSIALPLGISFFIFETISYLVDVRRGATRPAKRWIDYAMYLSFFPHLIAGPIYRYSEIVPDLDATRRDYRFKMVRQGLFLFSLGLAKKCLIANPLAQLADKVFALPKPSVIEAWSGALCYSFQIYFDFSGYSTMAIGLGLLLGFHLPQNFNQPYTATSVTDFWRRWHITLSRWFRDYLYIPLGGNRVAPWRTYLNLAVVFLLCGLWHGASVTFLLWGAYHGGLLIFERIFSGHTPKLSVAAPLRRAMTFMLILFGWVLFRASSFHQTLLFWGALCGSSTSSTTDSFLVVLFEDFRLTGSVVLASLALLRWDAAWTLIVDADRYPFTKLLVSIGLLALCLLELAAGTFNPFIYYRF